MNTTNSQKIESNFRLRTDDIEVTSDAIFENDSLGREPFVTATVELLESIREPFVIALNAPWGSGKTTTLKFLEAALESKQISAIRFNAWEVDNATDPLVPLVAELHERLLRIKGFDKGVKYEQIQRFKKVGSTLAKHSAIAVAKIATVGLLDMHEVTKDVSDVIKDTSEGISTDLIDVFKQERQAAEEFQKLLHELIVHSHGDDDEKNHPPFVLMVDELDRCRPTFAISMLERIKHFFNIPSLVFILSIDMEQLEASTRKVYGADINAAEYLRRFIDLELSLPAAKVEKMIDTILSSCGADEFFSYRKENYSELKDDRQWIVSTIIALANNFNLSLRIIQRMVSRLMLVIRQTSKNSYLDPVLVVFMIFLRMFHDGLLRKYLSGEIQANEVMSEIKDSDVGGRAFYESHVGMLIEAYLFFAHKQKYDYVNKYFSQIHEFNASDVTVEQQRVIEVSRRFENIRNQNFNRFGINLEDIERRINLVSSDLIQR